MKHSQIGFDADFSIIAGNARSQAAVMIVPSDESVGGPDNRHTGSDQWLYVAAGQGSATIDGEVHVLRPGTVLLIERGEAHEIRNEGGDPLHTVNFYVPPAYSADGHELPAGS